MIKLLKTWVQNILPIVYDDSLSYYEVVSKVVAKTNEIIENTNKNTQDIEDLVSVIDSLGNIDELRALLDEVEIIVNDLYTEDLPIMDGVSSAGMANHAARSDHVHPTDTSLAKKFCYVIEGNKCNQTIPNNSYVIVVNSTIDGAPDGAYKAQINISANTAITSSYLSAITNALNDVLNITKIYRYTDLPVHGDANTFQVIQLPVNVTSVRPTGYNIFTARLVTGNSVAVRNNVLGLSLLTNSSGFSVYLTGAVPEYASDNVLSAVTLEVTFISSGYQAFIN